MGIVQDLGRVRKLARETMLIEVLREFPDATEEDLVTAIEGWKTCRGKSVQEKEAYALTGLWPGESK